MRIDEARDVLRGALDATAALRDLDRQRERYLSMIGGPGMRFGAGSMTKNCRSMTEDIAIKLADLESDLQAEELRYLEQIQKARALIARIDKAHHRRVLTLRYLCGASWAEIGKEMGYSDDKSIFRVHGWALRDAQRVLNQRP